MQISVKPAAYFSFEISMIKNNAVAAHFENPDGKIQIVGSF